MICTFELNDADTKFVTDYAERTGQIVEEVAKQALVDYVREVEEAERAWAEFEKDPVTYTLDEVEQHLGLA